jgi:biotin carboxylase
MGDDEQTILIVGGKARTVRKARDLGFQVVDVLRPDEYETEHAALVKAALLTDYTDWHVLGSLIDAARRVFRFCGVVTVAEQGAEPVGLICDTLGLRGNTHRCARLLRDKSEMRRHLAGSDGSVAAQTVAGIDSMTDFGERHGYPFIVKPTDASASFGVHLVTEPEAVEGTWQSLTRLRNSRKHQFAHYFPISDFIMEEYLEGPEYSVESLSFNGSHVLLAITEKLIDDNFVEYGHAMPARLAPADEVALFQCVTAFLEAILLRHGPAHTEVKLTDHGPRIIESHSRPGGDRIRDLVEAVYGVDIERYAIGWAAGTMSPLDASPAPRGAAATQFIAAEPGRVPASTAWRMCGNTGASWTWRSQ